MYDDYDRYNDYQAIIEGVENTKSNIADKKYMKKYIDILDEMLFDALQEQKDYAERIEKQENKELEQANLDYEKSKL